MASRLRFGLPQLHPATNFASNTDTSDRIYRVVTCHCNIAVGNAYQPVPLPTLLSRAQSRDLAGSVQRFFDDSISAWSSTKIFQS